MIRRFQWLRWANLREYGIPPFSGDFSVAVIHGYCLGMRLRAEKNKLKIEHSIIDGLRPVLERLLRDNAGIRSIIPGVIRQVRDAKGHPVIRITVPTTNGWKAIALSAGARQELFVSTTAGQDELAAMIKAALDNG